MLVLCAILLILKIIGLIGVIKENKYIIITMTVLSAIEFIGYITQGYVRLGIISILIAILTGYYGYMIIKKEKTEKNRQIENYTV